MSEVKQTNFRISTDTADEFRQFCEEHGMNQAQGFDHIMEVLRINQAKNSIPDRLTEIETFEKNVKDITNSYLNSLQIAEETKERVREEFKTDIQLRDEKISSNAIELAEKEETISFLNEMKKRAEENAESAKKDAEQAIKEADAAKQISIEKEKINVMLSTKLTEAEEKLEGYADLKQSESELKDQVAKLSSEREKLMLGYSNLEDRIKEQKTLYTDSINKCTQLTNMNTEYSTKIAELQRDLVEQQRTSDHELKSSLSEQKKDYELALERAVYKKEHELQNLIDSMRDEKTRLQVKVETLTEQLKELKGLKETEK